MAPATEPPPRSLPAANSQPSPPNAAAQPRAPLAPSASTSPDTDVDMVADAAPAKRAANAAEKPPLQKRPRRLTWYDSVRDAWKLLVSRFPQRQQFKLSEIVDTVNSQWSSFRGKEKKSSRWKKEIAICVRSDTILTRSADNTDEYYIVRDLHYLPKPNAKKNQPTKKKDFSDDDVKVPEEQLSRATIPSEWTTEAFKPVRLSSFDKSPAIQFIGLPSANTVKGYKGFRMVRSTSGVCEGDWFFEAKVLPYQGDGAVRLGWSQRRSDPETPVGFDVYGYGYRDRTGGFVHAARVRPYSEKFGMNDVIGCRIQLPNLTDEQKQRIKESDGKWLHHRFINLLQGQQPQDCDIDIHGQAFVQFYKNGHALGIPAFFTEKEPSDSRPSRKPGAEKRPNEHLEGSRAMSDAARDAPPPEPAKSSTDPNPGQEKGATIGKYSQHDTNGKQSEDTGSANVESEKTLRPPAVFNDAEQDANRGSDKQNSADDKDGYREEGSCQKDNDSRHDQGHPNAHGNCVTDVGHNEEINGAIGDSNNVPIVATVDGNGTSSAVIPDGTEQLLPTDPQEAPLQSDIGVSSNSQTTGESKAASNMKAAIDHIVNP